MTKCTGAPVEKQGIEESSGSPGPCSPYLLQTAGEPAADALQRPDEADDLAAGGVVQPHGEAPQRAAAIARAAVVLLFRVEDVLAQAVPHLVLVVAFKANESCGEKGCRGRGSRRRPGARSKARWGDCEITGTLGDRNQHLGCHNKGVVLAGCWWWPPHVRF